MMQSVFIGSDSEMIDRILRLHDAGHEILDASFGYGRFWTSLLPMDHETKRRITGIDVRMGELDIARCYTEHLTLKNASWENIPFESDSFDVVVCDPPFTSGGGSGFLMVNRYSTLGSYDDLIVSLKRGFEQFDRVLRPGGFVIVKVMDLTEGRRRRFTHIDLVNATSARFRLDDLFVKVAVNTMDSPKWKAQSRSRAAHSYFLVFKRRRKSRSTEQ